MGLTGLLFASWLVASASGAPPPQNVLVIFANNRLLPANVEVDRGLREVIVPANARDVRMFAEFLDTPSFSGETYEAQTAAYLREKYGTRPPQVIVPAGAPALEFVLRYRRDMFPDAPVVHVGITADYLQSRAALASDVIGIPVEYDLVGTAELALRLHPSARKVAVVTGTSRWDRDREAEIRHGIEKLNPHLPVEYLSGLTSADLLATLAKLQRDDVVITPGFFRDGAGRDFSPFESVAMMAPVSGAPVYGPFITFLGTGVVGGRMSSYFEMGRETGAIIKRILDGERPSSIDVPPRIAGQPQFDWRQLRKWDVSEDGIPSDAIIHFREPTFWQAYRTQAIVAAVVFALQAGLIVALLVERRLRRRTASALAESEQRMSLAAHAARLSMWIWDLAHDRVWGNAKLREHAGLSGHVAVNFDEVLRTVHPADRARFDSAVRDAAANSKELDVEYRVVQPNGEVRWFAARGHAGDGEPDRLAGVKMDITARKEAEVQAAADRAALTHMSRVATMGQLSAAIAHQLNQPLAAILGNAETATKLLDHEPVDVDELREILEDVVSEDHRAAEVIRRLGALYKRGEVEKSAVDLDDLVRETLGLLRAELSMRHVSANIDLQGTLPRVLGGRIQLQQVLLNLILNAADAMGGLRPEERVLLVRTFIDGNQVGLCVSDCGTGIAPQNLNHVFDPFWSTKSNGVGVGLAICHAIVTAHGGTLTAANNPDRGAVFCMTLPQGELDSEAPHGDGLSG